MAHLLQRLTVAFLAVSAFAADTPPAERWPPVQLKPFNHKKHLALGNIAPVIARAIDSGTYLTPKKDLPADFRAQLNTTNQCEACHRGLAESTEVTLANMPRMADCLVCHDQIELPYSCAFCHPKDAKLKPTATHTPDFLDKHPKTLKEKGGPLEKESCAVCHGVKFRCLGCH